MKFLIIIGAFLQLTGVNAQSVLSKIPSSGNSLIDFIPSGYDTIMTASGDLNKDQQPDLVAVLRSNKEEEADRSEMDSLANRIVVILFRNGSGYTLAAKSDNMILCKECGGMMGDPFADIRISRNVLTISHYGGSSWRWGYDHKFRYQGNAFYLIGERSLSYHNIEQCERLDEFAGTNLKDINYLTGDYIEKKVSDEGCKLLVNKKGKIKKQALKTIAEFTIEN